MWCEPNPETMFSSSHLFHAYGSSNSDIMERRSRSESVVDDQETVIRTTEYMHTVRQLDLYYGIMKRKIMRYQSPTTGLFPRLSNDRKEAYLRDSIYCAVAIWGLYQAYKRIDDDRGKSHELGHSAVKCMRGILFCWMRQSLRLEQFKQNQSPQHALHSKFDLVTGEPVVECNNYGHLQLDIPSLYLIYLVQMITSGLQVIYTMDEVHFIQNLVYYVERAYRTPDFGMWERGSKYNQGNPEVHASSIGMAKAALEAINGCNLFGEKGTSWSVIYVDIDAHNRNRSIFETLIPRESSSRNTDASLLSIISFPCFATHDEVMYARTKEKIIRKLKGDYGFKRFLRDGYKTCIEDPDRRFYLSGELKNFDQIENEWPLFDIYLIIDGVFKNNQNQVKEYQQRIHDKLQKDFLDDVLVPMYFAVPEQCVELERSHPKSNHRIPSEAGSNPRKIFLWGQSLYFISQLLVDNLLHINELDPIRRYLPSYSRPRRTGRYSAFQGSGTGTAADLVVQIVLIAESARLQAMMGTYGIQTQTPHEVEPIQICSQKELVKMYEHLGVNPKLGLEGRPSRPIGSLGTSKLYRVLGNTILTYPLMFDVSDFYLSHDMSLVIEDIKNELNFVGRYWRLSGRPTVCILLREEHMRDDKFKELIDLLAMMKTGRCDRLQVRIGRVQNLISSSCIEHLDFLHTLDMDIKINPFRQIQHASAGYQSLTDIPKYLAVNEPIQDFQMYKDKSTQEIITIWQREETFYGESQLLGILVKREGPDFIVNKSNSHKQLNANLALKDHIQNLSRTAGARRHWQVVRYCASLLQKIIDGLSPYMTSLLVNGKQVTFGMIGHDEILVDRPLNPGDIKHLVYSRVQPHNMYQAVLQQEIMQYMGKLISTHRHLFAGILKLRVGWIMQAMTLYAKYFQDSTEPLESLAPSSICKLVYDVLNVNEWTHLPKCTPFHRRQIEGALGMVPENFYDRVWLIIAKSSGGIIIAGTHLPQQPTIFDMTLQDLNFAYMVENMLSRIAQTEHKQIIVELIIVVSTIMHRNPELKIGDTIDTDKLVNEAIKLYTKDQSAEGTEQTSFYSCTPNVTTRFLARAVVTFILKGATSADVLCTVS